MNNDKAPEKNQKKKNKPKIKADEKATNLCM